MRIISAVFALLGVLPVMPAAVASSLDGATRLYALLIFVLICAAVAFFASLSPSRRRAREIRRQVLQQQQNQAMNQQVPSQQTPSQQVPPQQVQGAVSYPMHYQPKQAQPGHSAQQSAQSPAQSQVPNPAQNPVQSPLPEQGQVSSPQPPRPVAAPSPLEPMQVGGPQPLGAEPFSREP